MFGGAELDWRRTHVKLKVSSSSLAKRKRKAGEMIEGGSGSFAVSAQGIKMFRDGGKTYLDVFDRSAVAAVTFCVVARGRERVGVERDEGATTRVCDVDTCDRDCQVETQLERRAWHDEQRVRTSSLIFEVDRSTVVRAASYVAHAATRADAPPAPSRRVLRLKILPSCLAICVECGGLSRWMRRRGCYAMYMRLGCG